MQESQETPITVAFWFAIPESATIEDRESEDGKQFHEATAVTARESGFPVYWGRMYENPDTVLVLVGFKSLDARIESRTAEWRRASIKRLLNLSTSYPEVCHIEFTESIIPALDAPCCTFASAYFNPTEEPAELRSSFEEYFNRYQVNLANASGGNSSQVFGGWSLEENVPYAAYDGGEPRKGKGFFFASGWDNPKQMMGFHESEFARREHSNMVAVADGWVIQNLAFNRVEAKQETQDAQQES